MQTFELSNILYQRQSHKDMNEVSRKLYWLIELQFARLGISQEIPTEGSGEIANGQIIKKLAGGGDEHVARRNFDRKDTHFKIETTFLMMGNNELVCDEKDTDEHRHRFNSVNQFKTAAVIDEMRANGESELLLASYKIADPSIKTLCKTEEWANAIVYLLYENYVATAVPIEREINEDTEDTSLRGSIIRQFEITKDKDDVMLCSDVESAVGGCKKKIVNELASMGVIKKKMNSTKHIYYGKWVYIGMRTAPEEEVEFVEEL